MIRRVNFDSYFLDSRATPATFGGWDGVYRVRAAAANRSKAMQVFRRATPETPLNPAQNPGQRSKGALSWDDGDAA